MTESQKNFNEYLEISIENHRKLVKQNYENLKIARQISQEKYNEELKRHKNYANRLRIAFLNYKIELFKQKIDEIRYETVFSHIYEDSNWDYYVPEKKKSKKKR